MQGQNLVNSLKLILTDDSDFKAITVPNPIQSSNLHVDISQFQPGYRTHTCMHRVSRHDQSTCLHIISVHDRVWLHRIQPVNLFFVLLIYAWVLINQILSFFFFSHYTLFFPLLAYIYIYVTLDFKNTLSWFFSYNYLFICDKHDLAHFVNDHSKSKVQNAISFAVFQAVTIPRP